MLMKLKIIVFVAWFLLPVLIVDAQNIKPIPIDTTYSVSIVFNKVKEKFPYASPVHIDLPKEVKMHEDVTYLTIKDTPYGKRELHLDIFQPSKKGKYPLVLMIHGGGWRAGNKSLQVPLAMQIASKGYITATVEYQLSLEAKFPAAVHNIKAAIRWLKLNADKYNIDTNRIAISGCSAGGHLASLVGLTNDVEYFEGDLGEKGPSSNVQAIIDIDGVINFLSPNSLNLNRRSDSPDVEWLGGSFNDKPDVWKTASPIYWSSKASPPILFINSNYPRFHAGQDELIGMYNDWGIYYEVHKFKVNIHPFWLLDPWFYPTTEYMVNFLDKVF